MKKQSVFFAFAAAAVGSLVAPHSKAAITDSLTGPTASDMTTYQSALTASQSTDGRNTSSPYVNSNQGNSFGNSRFGAGYNVGSYTGVSGGSAEGYASLTATATAFGDTRTAWQSYLYALTSGPSQSANVYAYVYALGNLVASGSHAGADFNGAYYLTSISKDLWSSGSQTFYISIIPITVGATVKGTAGQSLYGHVWVDGVNAHLNQGATLTASAFGGIGPSWANAGIKVNNLTLVNASLSLNSVAQYVAGGNPCTTTSNVGEGYQMYLKELGGEIALYASANLLFTTISDTYKIASWPGLTQSWTLVNYPATTQNSNVACFPVPAAPVVQGIIIG